MKPALILAPLTFLASPASAEVLSATPTSFEVSHSLTIEASIPRTWETLRQPAKWWDHDHTYSDDSKNLTLDPVAGGCFCEKIPPTGSVQHMQVVYVQPPRMMRLMGGLGPLQAEAVSGTMTIKLDPDPGNAKATKVTLTYIVGGFARAGLDQLAPKVDEVLAEQLLGLKSAAEAAVPANTDESR